MTLVAGVFKTEQQAIDAIEALEAEGFSRNDIKVFAKHTEDTRRIESETDVHADEVQEMAETRNAAGDGITLFPWIAAAPLSTSGVTYVGGASNISGAGPYYGAGIFAAGAMLVDDTDMERTLRDLGWDDDQAEDCRKAIAEGNIIVAADLDDSEDGSGKAEAAFRRCSAQQIVQ